MAKTNAPHPTEAPSKVAEPKEEIRGILHLGDRDVKGTLSLGSALLRVKGVGYRLSRILANVIHEKLSIPGDIQIGRLSEGQIDQVEEIIKNPAKYGVAGHLLNRQKDSETGKNVHLISNDLTFAVRQDVETEKNLFSWRGYRHAFGQKVRGQRTRTTGRKGTTMGVSKTKVRAATAAKSAPGKPAAKK